MTAALSEDIRFPTCTWKNRQTNSQTSSNSEEFSQNASNKARPNIKSYIPVKLSKTWNALSKQPWQWNEMCTTKHTAPSQLENRVLPSYPALLPINWHVTLAHNKKHNHSWKGPYKKKQNKQTNQWGHQYMWLNNELLNHENSRKSRKIFGPNFYLNFSLISGCHINQQSLTWLLSNISKKHKKPLTIAVSELEMNKSEGQLG